MDITNPKDVLRVVEEFEPDVIIHGAAMTHVDDCELYPEQATLMNVEGTRHMAPSMHSKWTHTWYTSARILFSTGRTVHIKEEAEPNPISHYGWTKLEAEKNCRATIVIQHIKNSISYRDG